MDKLFLTILNMSLTGAFVVTAICLVRLPLKKAPKIISYCLWAVAGFRLMFPFSIESVFSLIPFKAQTIPQDIAMQQIPRIDSGIPFVNNAVSSVLPAATPQYSVNPLQIWIAAGAFLWITGVTGMLIYGVLSFFILKRKMKEAAHIEANIYEAENIRSPFVLGVFAPKIYLPIGLSEKERGYIILHEQTHIRRRDHIVKFVAYFILCLHWFNPLAWVAFLFMGADMEMSCDERVLKEMGGETKKDYSLSLLSLATEQRIIGGSPLAFGEGGIKERIKNVLNFRKPSRVIIVAAVALVAVLSVGLAVNRANSAETSNEIPTVYANSENGSQIELVRFGYTWNYGDLLASEQEIVHADTLAPFQYEDYGAENTITVPDQAVLKLSTNNEKAENGYDMALSYTIWKPDGTIYDDGHREVYDSLSHRIGTDNNGNIVLYAPFEVGEYIYCVELAFERGTVIYAFKVIVSFVNVPEAQELVREHYPEAAEIRYTGEKDINYTNPPAPVDVFTFEVDVNGETVICAVSKERGIFFTYSDGTWYAFMGLMEWSGATQYMTLDDVRAIAQKIGPDLTMGDLVDFIGEDVGHGMYVVQYYIEDAPYLLLVSSTGNETVMYANLIHAAEGWSGESIDIRYYDVDKFITDDTKELVHEFPMPEPALKSYIRPTEAKWTKDHTLGADMAQLDFANESFVIFHGYFGLFVYDLQAGRISRSLDLAAIGCSHTQGDDYCQVKVSLDGSKVYLHPMNKETMYVYDLSAESSLSLYETEYRWPEPNEYFHTVSIETAIPDISGGVYSDRAVKFEWSGGTYYGYLYTVDWTLETLNYIADDEVYVLFD